METIRNDVYRAVRYNACHACQVASVFSRPVYLPVWGAL